MLQSMGSQRVGHNLATKQQQPHEGDEAGVVKSKKNFRYRIIRNLTKVPGQSEMWGRLLSGVPART